MIINNEDLVEFIRESNRIEGLRYEPLQTELEAHVRLLSGDDLTVDDVSLFVRIVAGAKLRDKKGLDVRVGDHVPPLGGSTIRTRLEELLTAISHDLRSPRELHVAYETLHPYTDGNGRSGRALWAWGMLHHGYWPGIKLGFLHAYYYQTLAESRK